MFDFLFSASGMLSLVTLVLMEIVLGIDNIIFIAILCGYLPNRADQHKARVIGLSLALIFRILLLATISTIVRMVTPLFYLDTFGVSGRDVILFAGGVFLIFKTVKEVYYKLKGHGDGEKPKERTLTVIQAIIQITIIDILFSFDSILTAVGLSRNLAIMITAVTISMFVMLFFAPFVGDFINKFPTIKMIALTFLAGIGFLLLFESLHIDIDKGYLYAGMAFSVCVELINIRVRKVMEGK